MTERSLEKLNDDTYICMDCNKSKKYEDMSSTWIRHDSDVNEGKCFQCLQDKQNQIDKKDDEDSLYQQFLAIGLVAMMIIWKIYTYISPYLLFIVVLISHYGLI